MTVALVLAAEPAAGLCGQLTSLGVRRVDATDDAGPGAGLLTIAAAARAAGEQVLICAGDLAVPRQAMARLLGTEGTAGYAAPREGCRAILVDQKDLRVLAEAAEYLASRPGIPDHVSALAGELERRGVTVRFIEGRPDGDADRDEDGLVAELFADPIARDVARWAADRALAPAALMGISLGLGLVAAIWYTEPTATARAVAAVALLAAFVTSRSARVLAAAPGPVLEAIGGLGSRGGRRRGTGVIRPAGDWLSAACWMITEFAVYAGLAASAGLGGASTRGVVGSGPGGAWHLAVAAMGLLAVRRMTDLCYERATERTGGRIRLPHSARRRRAERALALPAGERAVLLIVTGGVWGPRVAFLALLGWGTVAAAYVLAARIAGLRDTATYVTRAEPAVAHVDQGTISFGLGRGDRGRRDGGHGGHGGHGGLAVAGPSPAGDGVAAYRDDGPVSLWLGRLVEGRLPPLPPTLVAVFVTAALAALGLGNMSGILVLTPVEAMLLLAGLGSGHPHDGRLDWLVPPLIQAGEYLFIAALAFTRLVAPPVVFALVAALVLHHFDVAYRARHRAAWPGPRAGAPARPGPRPDLAGLGWELRMLVVGLSAAFGIVPMVCAVLAGYLWVAVIRDFLTGWMAVTDEPA